MAKLIDLSHRLEAGMVTYKGLPAPIMCDFLSREESAANYDGGETFHQLGSTIYNDVQVAWTKAFNVENFKLSLGVNNLFDEDPPICYTCSLNGYDAGTYDLPGMFWAVTAKYGF